MQWITRTLGTNMAEKLYANLNDRHFVQGQKLNDRDMLIEAAASVGADREATRAFIESGEGTEEIQNAQRRLASLGVSGIPTLILGGQWQMPSGAVGAETLVEAFRMVEARGGAPDALFAEDLAIPDHVVAESLDLDAALA